MIPAAHVDIVVVESWLRLHLILWLPKWEVIFNPAIDTVLVELAIFVKSGLLEYKVWHSSGLVL